MYKRIEIRAKSPALQALISSGKPQAFPGGNQRLLVPVKYASKNKKDHRIEELRGGKQAELSKLNHDAERPIGSEGHNS